MTPEVFFLLALAVYALGAALALGGLRWEPLRRGPGQHLATGLGVLLQTFGIGLHCARSETHFFTSKFESVWLLAWTLGLAYLALLLCWNMRALGSLVLPLIVALLVAARLYTEPGLPPAALAARHPLFAVHILSAFFGYGLFLTACAASVLYLEEHRLLKRKLFGFLLQGLPSLEKLERTATLCAWAGLLIFTVAVGTGATMAKRTGQAHWYLEPFVLSTQTTWLVFLVLVVGRATGRLAGRAAAKVILVGAGLVLVTFLIGHPFREALSSTARARVEERP